MCFPFNFVISPARACARVRRKQGADNKYVPVTEDPACYRCTPDLTASPAPRKVPCRYCGAERMGLYDVPAGDLKVPDVSLVRRRAFFACCARVARVCLTNSPVADDDARHEFARLIHAAVLAYCISLLYYVCGVVCIYMLCAVVTRVFGAGGFHARVGACDAVGGTRGA